MSIQLTVVLKPTGVTLQVAYPPESTVGDFLMYVASVSNFNDKSVHSVMYGTTELKVHHTLKEEQLVNGICLHINFADGKYLRTFLAGAETTNKVFEVSWAV